MWNRLRLGEEYNSDIPANINFAGNYILFFPNKTFYVGESGNITKRLKTHIQMGIYTNQWITRWGTFSNITIAFRKEKEKFERLMIEARFIERLKPQLNKSPGRWRLYV